MTDMDRRLAQLIFESKFHRYSRRDLMKRGLALGLSMSAINGLLASASAAPGATSRVSAMTKQEAMLNLYHDKGPWQELFNEMGQMGASEIGVGFEGVPYGDTTSYQNVILSSLPTEEAPDLFTWWVGYRLEELVEQGTVMDLSSLWQTAIKEGNLTEAVAAPFTFDGKQYGVPLHVSYWPIFYNKRVFEANGLTPPETWDDVIAVADQLKVANIVPFHASIIGRWPSFVWFEELLIRTDPIFYEELMAGQQSYTDPVVVSVMETWKSMIDAEYFGVPDLAGPETIAAFANGELAMMLWGTWYNAGLLAEGLQPSEDYGLFILPNVNPDLKENVIIFDTEAIHIPVNAPNAQASLEVAEWWVLPEPQRAWANKLGDTPGNPKVESENPELNELVATMNEQSYRPILRYWESSPVPIVEAAVDEFARFMLNPNEYMDVLETIEGIARREWSRRG